MPADSGWYWCDTDSYQTVTHVTVENLVSLLDLVTYEMRSLPARQEPPSSSEDISVVDYQKKGTADQLQVYETYQKKWQ